MHECLDNKISINGEDKSGATGVIIIHIRSVLKIKHSALYWASYGGHVEVVEELLSSPYISLNTQNKLGDTPLLAASYKGYSRVVHLLLNKKADPNTKNNSGDTASSVATDATGKYKLFVQ